MQDLTVEDRVSRTQFQYSLEDPDARELATWAPRLVERLQALPELRDVASDQQNAGLEARLVIDRDTASRLGITPQMLDDTLYDAFGQRQVSTMFTQLNQYRVVLEVAARASSSSPDDLDERLPALGRRRLGAARRLHATSRRRNAPLAVNHQGQFPVVTVSFNLAPRRLARRRGARDRDGAAGARPAREHPGRASRARRRRSAPRSRTQPLLILAALVTVYIVLGVLYESYIHPITILSTLPSAGVGALLALMLCRDGLLA